jgi:succinoglycan biosynthesis transport protein ExoP
MRDLKTSLDLARTIGSVRTIAISSLGGKEGKSTIVGNIGRLFAGAGTKTVLIDANVSNPTLSRLLAPQAPVGLLEILSGEATLVAGIQCGTDGQPDVIPISVGSGNPMRRELIGSQQMRNLLDELGSRYDVTIIDLPALLEGADARAVSPFVDGFVFVGEWGRTPADVLKEAVQFLSTMQVNLLGVVINKVEPRAMRQMRDSGQTYYA